MQLCLGADNSIKMNKCKIGLCACALSAGVPRQIQYILLQVNKKN